MEESMIEGRNQLINLIRQSKVYTRYQRSAGILAEKPALFDQVMDLRAQTIFVYRDIDSENLFEDLDHLSQRYDELQKHPEVSEFLDAEEDLTNVLKEFNRELINAMNLRLPS